MLEGIKEKLAMLIYDIEKEVGKDSKLYVHAFDIYADVLEIDEMVKKLSRNMEMAILKRGEK